MQCLSFRAQSFGVPGIGLACFSWLWMVRSISVSTRLPRGCNPTCSWSEIVFDQKLMICAPIVLFGIWTFFCFLMPRPFGCEGREHIVCCVALYLLLTLMEQLHLSLVRAFCRATPNSRWVAMGPSSRESIERSTRFRISV